MSYFTMPYIKLCCVATLGLLSLGAAFAEEAEFDDYLLRQPTGARIDTTLFRYGNPIPAGEYLADVYVNKEFQNRQLIRFIESDTDPIQGLCWSSDLHHVLDIKPTGLKLPQNASDCAAAVEVTPELTYKFDITNQRLDINIPQALLTPKPVGYIPKHLWQSSEPVGFLRYQFQHHQRQDAPDGHFLGVQTGINFGEWSLRHHGSLLWQEGQSRDYQDHSTYLQRDIDKIDGRIKIGDIRTQSTLLENVRLQGVLLASDRRMLPQSQNGYAPQISGYANTNALIRISQKNSIIYEKTVPAGAFEITDLYALAMHAGDVTVEVIEEDGTIQKQIIPMFNSLNLLRPKQLFYQAAIGYLKDEKQTADQPLMHASANYGINNHLTLQAGGIVHKNHQLFSSGLLFGSSLGVLSGSVDVSHANDNDKPFVDKIQLGFSKYFTHTKTQLNTEVAHHFHRGGMPLSPSALDDGTYHSRHTDLKNQYRLSINQKLGEKFGGLSVSAIANEYWQKTSDYNYRISYGNVFRGIQYQLGVIAHAKSAGKNDPVIYFNAAIPLGSSQTPLSKRVYSSVDYTHQGDKHYKRVAVNQNFGDLNQYNYGISVSQQSEQKPSIVATLNAALPQVKLGVLVNKTDHQTQYNYSASGAVVAHAHGITLNHDLGETFGIIQAKGATGVPIINGNGSKIDRWGHAIVSNLTPYQKNQVGIDARYLPDSVIMSATGKQIIPRAHSAQFISLSAQAGHSILLDINKTAKVPPFGAVVKDTQANILGYITPDQRVLIHSASPQARLHVSWQQDDMADECYIDYQLDEQQKRQQDLQILSVACQ